MPAQPPARNGIGFLQVSQQDKAVAEPVGCLKVFVSLRTVGEASTGEG